jgi:hypothetical protein
MTRVLRDDGGGAQPRDSVLIFFAASAVLWLATSSNGRYGVALFLSGGPVCGVMLSRLLPSRYVLAAIAAVLVWQGLLQGMLYREFRVASTPWASRYFDWNLPDRFQREPATFLTFGLQTGSTLAPRVHPASAHVNLVGQYTPVIDGPGSDRIRRIIAIPHRRLYGVFDFDYTQTGEPGAGVHQDLFQRTISGSGDWTSAMDRATRFRCARARRDSTWIKRAADSWSHAIPPSFIVCELRPITPAEHERALGEFRSFATKTRALRRGVPAYFEKPLSYTGSTALDRVEAGVARVASSTSRTRARSISSNRSRLARFCRWAA